MDVEAKKPMNADDSDQRFTLLFEQHHDEVLAYCVRRTARSDADDATAEVFAVAWRRKDEIQWDTVRPWLYGIARRVLANRWRSIDRRGRLRQRVLGMAQSMGDSPEVVVIRREQDAEVVEALNRLKIEDREVLMLAAWEELTAPQMAIVLGISVSAAEQRLHRAKRRFSKVFAHSSATQISHRAAEQGGRF